LGGGLATLAALLDGNTGGKKLVIFNPTYLHANTITRFLPNGIPNETFFKESNVWQVAFEPLSLVQTFPSKIPGNLQSFPIINVVYFALPHLEDILTRLTRIGERFDPILKHSLSVFDHYFQDK
jgi:hypothetical protein